MPADLQRHIRYPEDFFAIQARKYATYHMLDPQVFYNREDLWAIPRRTIEGRDREMEPYYTIMRLPGRDEGGVHPPHAVQSEPPRQHDRAGWPPAPIRRTTAV